MAKKLSVIHCIVPEVEGLNMAPGNYGSMGMGGWVRQSIWGLEISCFSLGGLNPT